MIYVFLTNGVEEMEAVAPIDLLRRAGVELQTVGLSGKTVTGSHQIPMLCDTTASEIDPQDCTGLILPGGPGHIALAQSPIVQDLVKRVAKREGLLAAICAAPSIFGQLGLLRGKQACCYPGFEDQLFGAKVLYKPVVIHDNIITSRGAGTATQFALALVTYLAGPKKSAEIARQIQCS